MNPKDEIRDAILRRLYEVHQKAKSPKSAAIGIRDLQKALKPAGYKQQDVGSNLDYLIQKNWARAVVETRTFTTASGTTQPSEKTTYKISDIGIDKLESASTFQREAPAGINITSINGVTVVGDGNVVNTAFTDLSQVLTETKTAVLSAESLGDSEKLDAAADIDALQSQLQKPHPDEAVVAAIWGGLEKTLTAAGLVELAAKVGHLISPMFG